MLSVNYRPFLLGVLILNVIMMSLQAQLKGGGKLQFWAERRNSPVSYGHGYVSFYLGVKCCGVKMKTKSK
jgi:hypothetical protein